MRGPGWAKEHCRAFDHELTRDRHLELTCVVAPTHPRKGIDSEAVQAMLAYCLKELSVHRVEALIHPGNAGSIRIAGKLGFRLEGGPLIDYWCVGEKYLSAMMYAYINTAR